MAEPPSAVTLDLWHTLVFLRPDREEAYMDAQLDLATEVLEGSPREPGAPTRSREELRSIFERQYAAAVTAAQRGQSVPPAAQLAAAAREAGRLPRSEPYVEGLTRLVARTEFEAGPGAVGSVRALRDRGWRTAVISNTVGEPGAALRPVLRRMGFDAVVEEYLFSDELPWTKPDPAIFREALRRLGIPPGRAIHVGDGWPDLEGARRAGLRAGVLYTGLARYGARYHQLFLPPDWASPPADFTIQRLEELPPLAARLLDGGATR